MTGLDASAAMVALARQRLGENAVLQVADVSEPPFAVDAFDDVVVSLVLHYLADWRCPWPSYDAF